MGATITRAGRCSCYRFFAFALVDVLFVAVRRRAVPFSGVAFWRPREAVLCAPGRWARCGEPPRAAEVRPRGAFAVFGVLRAPAAFGAARRPVVVGRRALFALACLPASNLRRCVFFSARFAGRAAGAAVLPSTMPPLSAPAASPASGACGTRCTRGLAAPAAPVPLIHGGMAFCCVAAQPVSLGLLPPLPRQVVWRQAAGRSCSDRG